MSNQDPIPGGGPVEGEDANAVTGPNPEGVHPDYAQATPEAPTPPPTAQPATERGSEEELGSE